MLAPLLLYLQKKKSGSSFSSWQAYLKDISTVRLNDNQKQAIFNIHRTAIPAAETPIRILLAQNFLAPRQQFHLNIKNITDD